MRHRFHITSATVSSSRSHGFSKSFRRHARAVPACAAIFVPSTACNARLTRSAFTATGKPLALWVEVSTLTRVSTRGGARRTGESASGASGGPSAG
jgi:hypothetical protein